MALLTDPVTVEGDLDFVCLDGELVYADWDTGRTTSPTYVTNLLKRLCARYNEHRTFTWILDHREYVTRAHLRYKVGPCVVDFLWVEDPEVL